MTLIDGATLTDVPGIQVGHWSATVARTGCTVIVLPEPNVTTGEIRGAAPATREYGLLAPGMTVEQVHAILLTGGSAFGLAAADGVLRELEAAGRGFQTQAGRVPIVPTAALFDLGVGDPSIRPTAEHGEIAYRNASSLAVEQGTVGAGTGATVSNWRGVENPGGIGSAAVSVGDATVAALVAVNAVGDVYSLEGEPLTGGDVLPGPLSTEPPVGANTTHIVVATDARLDRGALQRLCVRAHDALGVCVRPTHTAFDGDICFAVSAGEVIEESYALAEGAFEAAARALEFSVRPPVTAGG